MRSLLSTYLARNMSKTVKAENVCQFNNQVCPSYIPDKDTQCVDIDSESSYFFYPPVTVTDLQNNNKTEGVYIVTQGCYQISGIGDIFYETMASFEYIDLNYDYSNIYNSYFVLTKDAELNLILDVLDSEVSTHYNLNDFYVFNPNNFSAETNFNFTHLSYYTSPYKRAEEGISKLTDIFRGHFRLVLASSSELEELGGKMSESLTVKISGNDPGDIPQKIWKIVPGKLYTKDTPSDELPVDSAGGSPGDSPGDGLSAGAIAGIVIACVVVVGVVVFCIVWFVVLKKQCPFGNKSDNPSA